MHLDDSVILVPGIGPRRAEELAAAGVHTVGDLLLVLPSRYEDRSVVVDVAALVVGERCAVRVRVKHSKAIRGSGRRARLVATASDASGTLEVTWFNQPYLANQLIPGVDVQLYGTPSVYRDRIQMVNPVVEIAGAAEAQHVGCVVPIYKKVGELGPGLMRRLTRDALAALQINDVMPSNIASELGVMGRAQALWEVHCPSIDAALDLLDTGRSPAHRRLILEEFLAFQCAILSRRRTSSARGSSIYVSGEQCRSLRGCLPFRLTDAQRRVLKEILTDMRSQSAMHRLLHGDVGSGKTAVAACALLAVAQTGAQGALLVPTEMLARQQAAILADWAQQLGIRVGCMTGSTAGRDRRTLLRALVAGDLNIIVGTQALLENRVLFANLRLAIIDEQHRFGVRQRSLLANKGATGARRPDLLVMTATPIPRSLALTCYGDLDISLMDELPPDRQQTETRVVDGGCRKDLHRWLQRSVMAGGQAFVVAPRIDSTGDGLRNVIGLREELARALPELKVGLVHGSMEQGPKSRTLTSFRDGAIDVLVATTVIEVGIDVPRATLMVVEHAERFGLAQLHQLRGRVGRGGLPSACILVAHKPLTQAARTRLETMQRTCDGFEIAEVDLDLRGPGDLLGTRQSGAFGLRVGNPLREHDWLLEAREAAQRLLADDSVESRAYRASICDQWEERLRAEPSG